MDIDRKPGDPPAVTRRGLLIGGAAAVGAAAVALSDGVPAGAADDDFAAMRGRWATMYTGGAYDPADPDYAAALGRLDTEVDAARARLDRSPDRAQVFTDFPLTASWAMRETYYRLRTMATAYVARGATGEGDATLLADVLAGLATVHQRAYHAGQPELGNWWDWEIGSPTALNDVCVLLYDHVPPEALASYLAAIDFYVPDPTMMLSSTGRPQPSTGANRVWLCQVVGVRGVLGRASERIMAARDALGDVFGYVTTGDGFYADGSFIQHNTVAYTGSYGTSLLGGIASLMALLAGTPWAVTDPNRAVVLDSVDRTFAPVIYDGLMMDHVRGRVITRNFETDHSIGHLTIEHILRLAAGGSPEQSARWRAMCRGWVQRDSYDDQLGDAPPSAAELATFLGRLTLLKQLLSDDTVRPAPEPVAHHLFARMDRAVHRRPGWAFAIAMASERIAYYEYGNGENERGYHTGSGMTYLYNADGGQFTDQFWPTVDRYRLPGTTVDTKPLPNRAGGGDFGKTLAPTRFAGGATLGRFGAAGLELASVDSPARARKAWFCLDDVVVALGGGITGGSGHPVESIVENRNLHADGTKALRINGLPQPVRQDWSATLPDVRWAHLDGVAGYIFLGDRHVLHARREERTGSWRDINVAGPDTPITRRYLTLWLDHGTDPVDGSYAYLIAPGASPAATAAFAARPGVDIVANGADAQAVRVPALGITAAHLYAPGGIGGDAVAGGPQDIAADAPCTVLSQARGTTLSVAIADPTHRADTVTVRLATPGYRHHEGDGTVTVAGLSPTLVLVVDTSAHDGRSHTITLRR